MEKNNDKITSFQLMTLLIATMIGVGIMSMPREIAKAVGPDGWVLLIMGGLLILLLVILMSKTAGKFPQKTFKDIVNGLMGKILGTLILISFLIYFMVISAFEIRMFGEAVKDYLLLHTPIEVIIITILVTVAYAARSGIESISRLAQVLLPIAILIALLVALILIPELDFSNLLPVLRTPPLKLVKSLPITLFSFLGMELVLIFSAFVVDPQNITKRASLSIGFVLIIYLLIVILSTTRFGVSGTAQIIWPGIEVFKTIDIPDIFIENIEIFVLGGWIYLIFMTVVVLVFAGSLMLSYIFDTKEQNFFVLPTLPIIYYIALVPENFVQINNYINAFLNSFGLCCVVILPILLWILSLFKSKIGSGKNA